VDYCGHPFSSTAALGHKQSITGLLHPPYPFTREVRRATEPAIIVKYREKDTTHQVRDDDDHHHYEWRCVIRILVFRWNINTVHIIIYTRFWNLASMFYPPFSRDTDFGGRRQTAIGVHAVRVNIIILYTCNTFMHTNCVFRTILLSTM